MVADHGEHDRHYDEGVVLGAGLGTSAFFEIGRLAAFSAATMRRCAGMMRIQTFAAMIVPSMAPN